MIGYTITGVLGLGIAVRAAVAGMPVGTSASAPAATTAPSAPDLSTPQSAAKSFYRAVEAEDAAAVGEVFAVASPAERELAGSFAAAMLAGKRLNAAARAQFGETGEAIGAGTMTREELSRIDQGELRQEGDVATLLPAGQPRPIKLRRTEGKWRIVVSDFAGASPEAMPRQAKLLARFARVLNQAADEVTAGKYGTPQQAEEAIKDRLGALMITAAEEAGGASSTRPAATRP